MAAILATWRLCAFSLFSICRPCRRFLPSPSIWATTTSNDLHKKKKVRLIKLYFYTSKQRDTCSARFVVIIKYTRMSFLNPTGSAYEPYARVRRVTRVFSSWAKKKKPSLFQYDIYTLHGRIGFHWNSSRSYRHPKAPLLFRSFFFF